MADKLNKCVCGNAPKFHCERVAEDAEECWVECSCGRVTAVREDAYCDFASAAWERRRHREPTLMKISLYIHERQEPRDG
jgi:hypothetical protein